MSKERLFTKYFPLEFSYDKWGEWCTAANEELCFQFDDVLVIEEKKDQTNRRHHQWQ